MMIFVYQIHCGLVMPRDIQDLGHHWFMLRNNTCSLPSHDLKLCWCITFSWNSAKRWPSRSDLNLVYWKYVDACHHNKHFDEILVTIQEVFMFTASCAANNDDLVKLTTLHFCFIMTSSNGNIFRATGPLCGEFTGDRWIPHTKASNAVLWCFLWSVSE